MRKRTLSLLALITLILPLLAACGEPAATPTTATTPPTATTASGGTAATATTGGATTPPTATTASGGTAATATTGGATTEATATTAIAAAAATATSAPAGAASTPAATGNTTDKLMTILGTGTSGSARNFNPFSQNALLGANNFAYEPLMFGTIKGDLQPWLATAYKFSADAKTLTFTIRDGVQWSDGQPFSASDVAFTYNLLRDKPGLTGQGLNAMSAQSGFVDTVTAPDARTVVFTLKQPYSPAVYELVEQVIVPEHIWKTIADPSKETNENPVGTGPFTEITTYTPQQYEIHRNPHYWQADKIHFGGFKVVQGLSADAALLGITNGDYDWSTGSIPNIDQTYVAKDPQHRGYWNPAIGPTISLAMLTVQKPFDDPNVRKAISMAINRKQITTVGMQNTTKPADVTGLNDSLAAWKVEDPSKLGNWTDYNPGQANQMLDAAGLKKGSDGIRTLPDGTPMKYEIYTIQGFTDWTRSADIIVQNLKAVGISTSVKPVDFGTFGSTVYTGKFAMTFAVISGSTPYGAYKANMSAATSAPVGQPAYLGNFARFVSPKADDLLNQWVATTDPAKQKDLGVQLQQEFATQAPILPLFPQPLWAIYKTNNFTGFPTKDDPYAAGNPDHNPGVLLIFTHIQPVQ